MQMIEYRKEGILRFLRPVEKLNIIQDQHINHLIKMDEIIDGIVPAMILKLVDELLGTHIQHHLVGMQTLYFIAYRLRKVCFSQSNTTINHQRIK